MSFTQKSINASGDLGADLRELRERAGLSLGEVAKHTKIAESTVRGWEEGRWDEVEDPRYMERMLRSYVAFLGGLEPYFINKFREGLRAREVRSRQPEDLMPRPRQVKLFDLTVTSRLLTVAGFLFFVSLLGGYIYLQARTISAPPPLELFEPTEGLRIDNSIVHVRGKTLPESSVQVNEVPAVVQPDGTFDLTLAVPRGTTLIIVSARRRHGEEAHVARRVIYDRPLPPEVK